ncbi:MAG: hypothetical protein QXI27_03925 [Nitrososphaerota archaeon]
MISISKVLGILMMFGSTLILIIFSLWVFGYINGLDPNLAIKIAVYVLVIAILAIIGILGYIMATYPHPVIVNSVGEK